MITGNAISEIEAGKRGIHLFWTGPFGWLYSLKGWNIQRRRALREQVNCEAVTAFDQLRLEKELRLSFGWLSYSTGDLGKNTPAEIFRLQLDEPTSFVRLNMRVRQCLSFALYEGKVVATVPPRQFGDFSISFAAPAIDTIVSYIVYPIRVQYCIALPPDPNDKSWNEVPYLIRELQLPIEELDPNLQDPDEELQEAQSRLLPGEVLDATEFKELIDTLRPSVTNVGYPRQIDKTILIRAGTSAAFEELTATAPILSLISHPKWRRIMGFGWFDSGNDLSEGQMYEYRITGTFPAEDLFDKIYGFHTIASGTILPSCFFLNQLLLRFAEPTRVELAPGTSSSGKLQMSRRGIRLRLPDQPFWPFPSITDWSIVIDFPNPVGHVQLELMPGHDLQYEAWTDDVLINSQTLPSDAVVRIDLPILFSQLRLKGSGFLFTIRITQPVRGFVSRSVVLPPVLFAPTPRPDTPANLEARNLQEIALENFEEGAISTASTRSALGFQLQWDPSLQNGLNEWPSAEPTPPPIECSLYQIEHRQIPNLTWTPLLREENWMIGRRKQIEAPTRIRFGRDLMQLFPEIAVPEENTGRMSWDDVFDFSLNNEPVPRPLPPLGTTHQYRIRGVDIIGRSSNTWRESNIGELQKLIPPPVPVGPVRVINDEPNYTSPPGVHARVLVKDAPDLTAAESSHLGDDNNVIILKWGWYAEQRELDPFATEFRIYIRDNALDRIDGELVSVTQIGTGRFRANFVLDSAIRENEANGSFIQLGGHPYRIRSHEGGTSIQMVLDRRVANDAGNLPAPPTGRASIPLLITSDRLQAPSWSGRAGVVPLSSSNAYSFEFRNLLTLNANQPRAEIWIGVSSSDDQPYVPDKLTPIENRPGNESPIVPVRVKARYWGRPYFDIPPPLEDVPRLLTREPQKKPIIFELDCEGLLEPDALVDSTHIRVERASGGVVFSKFRVTTQDRIMAISPTPSSPDIEVVVPNPDDRRNIISALRGVRSAALADRYMVFLAGSHPYRSSFFEPVTADPVLKGPVTDNYQPQTERYVYRVRAANAAGLISEGDAVLKAVVRVPSLRPGPVPELINRRDEPGTIYLRLTPSEEMTHVVLFYFPLPAQQNGPGQRGSLLRTTNRPDLYPDKILRFRTPEGEFARQVTKNLLDPDVVIDSNGDFIVPFHPELEPGTGYRFWASSLTGDGIPSAVAGPWRRMQPIPQP